ncbi:MAG: Plug domain-containing protein, partial [Afipia sp.]|nr:Plug domain-containing protein [Afipia sp.]
MAAPQDAVAQNADTPAASTPLPTVDVVAPRVQQARRTASRVMPVVATPDTASDAPVASASEQNFTGEDVNARPFSRPAEALEVVPGLIVTQHSGDGKANQYFLRGFNLDHGTDLAVSIDGMPVNMRTHGHGQGYADLNFMIPELIGS